MLGFLSLMDCSDARHGHLCSFATHVESDEKPLCFELLRPIIWKISALHLTCMCGYRCLCFLVMYMMKMLAVNSAPAPIRTVFVCSLLTAVLSPLMYVSFNSRAVVVYSNM